MLTIAQILTLCLLQVPGQNAILKKDGQAAAADFRDAVEVNIRPGCRPLLAPIVAAIRYAENGRKGREFGVLHPRCPDTYRGQAGWCAATVQKNYDRWVAAGKKGDFLSFLASKYAPVGVDNDPNNLNVHWYKNVRFYVDKFGGGL